MAKKQKFTYWATAWYLNTEYQEGLKFLAESDKKAPAVFRQLFQFYKRPVIYRAINDVQKVKVYAEK